MSQRSRIVAYVIQHPGLSSGQISAALGRDCTPELTELTRMRHLARKPGVNARFIYYPAAPEPEPAAHRPAVALGATVNAPVAQAAAMEREIEERVLRRIASVVDDLRALGQLLEGVVTRLSGETN